MDTSTVAVTGAEGFIGSHLVEALVARGHRVRAMVQYNSLASHGWLDTLPADVLDAVEVQLGDVRDPACCQELLHRAGTVYHLAALIAIPYSYRAPRSYVETNVLGTVNVLDAARQHGVERVVHTSTSETYGTARTVPISEDHPTQAQSPYAASKAAADRIAESYHHSFGLPVVTLRPFNTYGPRQSTRAVIPTVIAQLAAGAEEIVLGDLRPTRDFTHVTDTARAFVAVGTAPAERVVGQVLNAGSGVEVSVGELVTRIGDVMGRQPVVRQDPERLRPDGSEVMRLLCDSRRLRAATGWSPLYDLESGLKETAAWFTEPANLARYRPFEYQL
ncbi:GDP-mannose 4,6-dehydratase [Allostreptomyces psammosilenae]|uniref:UDP-glucose 4-epimerase n=1 Tax=Allostreptomyces psammosilenae TaxID=1892865 RepID=A0A853A1V9_9ACTN|nr:GDP-mannose 4,6-dehydratase [Allostreptomyces psammosilenae]NYI08127.1 UDP-glucose 4-epimerase [Allostreptomyces psammosilenae]